MWRSANGESWERVSFSGGPAARHGHQVAVVPGGAFAYERAAIAATGPMEAVTVTSGTTPLAVATLMASGGIGYFRFSLLAGAQGVAVLETGELRAVSFLGREERATVSIVARDATPINSATVAVTLVYFQGLSLDMATEEDFVFSPGFSGAVVSLQVVGGAGEYAYSRVEGDAAFVVGADGAVSVATPLVAVGSGRAVFAVSDEGEGAARFTLNWEVRDGLGTPEEALFVVGGTDGSGTVSDVWRSADGVSWTRVAVSAFAAREGLQVAALGGTLWMAGGTASGAARNDVWRSTDGVVWSEVTQVAAFPARTGHQLAAFLGSLWVLGATGATVDVWASGDGASWSRVNASVAPVRSGHRVAAHGGALWVVGGEGLRDVWSSTDGKTGWTRRTARGASARAGHEAVSFGGSLLVVGGEGGGLRNDVQASENGANWARVTPGATVFPARKNHETAVYRGSLWVVGGEGAGGLGSDVWVSGDGASWSRVTEAAGFSPRGGHQVAVFSSVPPGAYRMTMVAATVKGSVTVFFGDVAPVTVATVTASGGIGAGRFEVVADVAGVASVGETSGVVVATAFPALGERATVSIRVRDATPINAVTVAVTLFRVPRLTVGRQAATLVVSRGYRGAVFTLSISGGAGVYSYRWVSGQLRNNLRVGGNGVVELIGELGARSEFQAVFEASDVGRETARFTLVFRKTAVERYEDAMFLSGGTDRFNSGNSRNDVWRSADGRSWVRLVENAQFPARYGHQMVSYGGSLWVVGGDGLRNDVWRSADGTTWEAVAISGSHFSRRFYHQMVSVGGRLWVMGGYDGAADREVWSSTDGSSWTRATDSATQGRYYFQAVAHRGSLWILGGAERDDFLHNDVWYSGDGVNWVSVAVSGQKWSGRRSHRVVSFAGSLWVVGGYDGSSLQNDVWRSADGREWTLVPATGNRFSARQGHQLVAQGGRLWVVGGLTDTSNSISHEVWSSANGESWTLEAQNAFPARTHHQVAVHRVAIPFVVEAAEISVSGVTGRLMVSSDDALPLTVATLTATGGDGAVRFEVVGDAATVARVEADGALVATNFVRGLATVSVVARDATRLNETVVLITIAFATPFAVSPSGAGFVVSPDFTGAVLTISATGGAGEYAYSRVEGPSTVSVGADTGVVSITAGLPVGDLVAVFEARDGGGSSGRFTLSLRVDGSGAFVAEYRDVAMFIMGGNSEDSTEDYGDVLRSTDGVSWASVSFPGTARHGHQAVFHDGSLWIVGGSDKNANYLNDVWKSADGENWDLVTATAAFSNRQGHQVVSFNGDLWLFGGDSDDGDANDVWRSENGTVWVREAASAAWGVRRGHGVVFHGGALWLMGGVKGSGNNKVYYDDVWRSADGVTWEEVTIEGDSWAGRKSHQVVSFGGTLWLTGGKGDDGRGYRDVWASADGVSWRRAVGRAPWGRRQVHQVVSYGGSLWLMGGYRKTNIEDDEGVTFDDIWRSADGVAWEEVAVTNPSPFPARRIHQMVVTREAVPFVHQRVGMAVTAPMEAVTVSVDSATAPVTVATITASGGVGDARRFEVAEDAAGVATVDGEGRVAVTRFLEAGMTATVSIRVRDATPVNSAVAVITVVFAAQFAVSPSGAGFVVSPDYSGVVLTISASGGAGGYAYSRVEGPSTVSVGADTGVVSITAGLPVGDVTAVFEVQDEDGDSARFTLSLEVDGSAVYATEYREGDVFLIGGRDDPQTPSSVLNDIWRSSDGENWDLITATAAFSGRWAHQAVSYGGSLWVIGVNDDQNKNDVWRSADGENWELVTATAAFSARWGHQAVSYGGSLWVIGGDRGWNDVWRSADGESWERVAISGGRFSGRRAHQAVSYGGSLWVIGGYDGSKRFNDVWRSADGEYWNLVTATAAFSGRADHQAFSYGGSLWVIGGYDGSKRFNDVWRSADGEYWNLVTATAAFSGRADHQAFSYGGSLWVIGGNDGSIQNDVWRSADGETWTSVVVSGEHFSGRFSHQVVVAQEPLPFIHERTEIVMATPPVQMVSLDTMTAQLTLLTLTGSGGMGGLRFNQLGGNRDVRVGDVRVGADGEIVVSRFPLSASIVTVSVLVSDVTRVNAATVSVTVAFVGGTYERLSWIGVLHQQYYVSPGYTGVVATMTAIRGFGGYRYECLFVCDSFGVDADTGVASLTTPIGMLEFGGGAFRMWDRGGWGTRFVLLLNVDYSGDTGMFIMGGNSDSSIEDYGDVLRSTDGETWTSFSFPGTARHKHQMVFHDGSLWVIGGDDTDSTYLDDIWHSADGESWTPVAVSGEHFSARGGHEAVSFGGDLWVFGGENDDDDLNDVWRSSDGGVNWVRATASAAWGARRGHEVVFHDGALWLMGGYDDDTYFDDVWRSTDGVDWEEVTIEGDSWVGRKSHQVVSFGGEMWLMGGKGDDGGDGRAYNDVWVSGNGANWRRVVESAPWKARQVHQVVSYRGSLWLTGGYNREGFDVGDGTLEGETYDDVWRSADGVAWEEVTVASPFPARRIHQMVVAREPPSIYRRAGMAVTQPGAVTVALDSATAPVTVATLTASGGVGDVRRFEVAGDAAGVATVDGEGRVAVTTLLEAGMTATVSIRVRDATPVNSAVAVITIAFAASSGGGAESVGVGFSPGSAGFLLSPGFTGEVLTISAMAPEPMVFAYQQVGDSQQVTVNERTGVVSVVQPLEGEGDFFFFGEGGGGAVYAELGGRCAGGDAGDVGCRGGAVVRGIRGFGGRRMGYDGGWCRFLESGFRSGVIIRRFFMRGVFGCWGGVMWGVSTGMRFGGRGMGEFGFR